MSSSFKDKAPTGKKRVGGMGEAKLLIAGLIPSNGVCVHLQTII